MEQPLTTLLCKEPPPEGKPWNKADNFCLIVRKHDEARGRLDVRQGFTFLPKKMKAPNFFQARGRHAKTSSVGRSRQLPRRGSRERGLSIKRLFDEKMPDCCSAAPHHLALQGASPQGEAAKRQYENLSSIVCLRRHFPRYRRFFRAFLSQEKKRKRGKQG